MIQALLLIAVLLPALGAVLSRGAGVNARLASLFGGGSLVAVAAARVLARTRGEVTPLLGVDFLSGLLALTVAALCLATWGPGQGRPARRPAILLSLQASVLAVLVLRDLLWICAALGVLVGISLRASRGPISRGAQRLWVLGIASLFLSVTLIRSATGQQALVSELPRLDRPAFNGLLSTGVILPDASGRWGYADWRGDWTPVTSDLSTLDALAALRFFEALPHQLGTVKLASAVAGFTWLGALALLGALLWARREDPNGRLGAAEVLAPAGVIYLALRLGVLIPETLHSGWPLWTVIAFTAGTAGWALRQGGALRPLAAAVGTLGLGWAVALWLATATQRVPLLIGVALLVGGVGALLLDRGGTNEATGRSGPA